MSLTKEHQTKAPVEATGIKQGSRILLDDSRSYEDAKGLLPDGPVRIMIVPVDKVREIKANNAYFGDLKTISESMLGAGFPDAQCVPDALHTMYKGLFNAGKSTTLLPAREFATYMERVRAHAAQEYCVEFAPRQPLTFAS